MGNSGLIQVTDKRGSRSLDAAARAKLMRAMAADEAERRRQARADWAQQAAGAMWWEAQRVARSGQADLADHVLAKRTELVEGARREGILSQ